MAGPNLFAVLWALAAVATALVGLVLVIRAVRGRRVNDHPICRRCGFDLVGLIPAAANCPECGAALRSRRAVRVGGRVRSRGAILVAAAVLLVGVVASVGLGVRAARGVRLYPLLPTLVLRAVVTPDSGRDLVDELATRVRDGRVSDGTQRALVAHALAAQGAARAGRGAWHPSWTGIFMHAWQAGLVSEEQEQLFISRAATLALRDMPSAVRPGMVVNAVLDPAIAISQDEYAFDYLVKNLALEVRVGDAWVAIPAADRAPLPYESVGRLLRSAQSDSFFSPGVQLVVPDLPPGTREARLRGSWHVDLVPARDDPYRVDDAHISRLAQKPLHAWSGPMHLRIDPPGTQTVPMVLHPESITEARAIKLSVRAAQDGTGGGILSMTRPALTLPICARATVYERRDGARTGRSWSVCLLLTCFESRGPSPYSLTPTVGEWFGKGGPPLDAQRVDVELVSHADCADARQGLERYAGVRVLYEDLEVGGDLSPPSRVEYLVPEMPPAAAPSPP